MSPGLQPGGRLQTPSSVVQYIDFGHWVLDVHGMGRRMLSFADSVLGLDSASSPTPPQPTRAKTKPAPINPLIRFVISRASSSNLRAPSAPDALLASFAPRRSGLETLERASVFGRAS